MVVSSGGGVMEKLRQYHKMATVIGYGMMGSLLIFAAIVETLKATAFESLGFLSPSTFDLLRYLFFGLAFIEFFVIRIIKNLILSRGGRISTLSGQSDPLLSKVLKLYTAAIISFAFCESVALYGFVLFIIGGSSLDFYLFAFLSLIFFAVYFPKYSQWEEWFNSN
jgi:hypothetical protein